MSGKFGKSGKGKGPGVLGARVGRGGVGKRGLEGRVVTMIGDNQALVREGEGLWEMISGLEKVDGGWTNGDVRVRESEGGKNGAKKGVVVEGGMEWEAEGRDLGLESGVLEEVLKVKREKLEEEKEGWKRGVLKGEKLKGVGREGLGVGLERIEEEVEENVVLGDGFGLLDAWREEGRVKERRLKEEGRLREKSGVVERGLEKGLKRGEVLDLWREWKDYRRVVEQAEYILGSTRVETIGFLLDREVRGLKGLEVGGGLGKGSGREEGRVRSEVVLSEKARKDEELEVAKKEVVVVGGRSYGEVLNGVGPGSRGVDVTEREKKLSREREEVVKSGLERERREVCRLEVVLDSQEEVSTDGWKVDEVERELGLGAGEVRKVVGGKGRVVVEVENKDVLGKCGSGEEKVGEMGGFKVVQRKRLDRWCGVVVPGVDVKVWENRLGDFKERFESLNGVKLMKLPGWLAGEEVRRRLKLEYVGMVVHVAKESERLRLLEEGISWEGLRLKGRRFVNGKEVERCTKCGVVGHSWWRCVKSVGSCDVCGVRGHTGWQHRCGRCNVRGKSCTHYGRCVMCKGSHASRDGNEGNCWGVRLEVERLRSLDG